MTKNKFFALAVSVLITLIAVADAGAAETAVLKNAVKQVDTSRTHKRTNQRDTSTNNYNNRKRSGKKKRSKRNYNNNRMNNNNNYNNSK